MGSLLLTGLVDSIISPKLFVIDDLADRPHKADVLVMVFSVRTHERYKALFLSIVFITQVLPALLAPEYFLLHRLLPPRYELRRCSYFLVLLLRQSRYSCFGCPVSLRLTIFQWT